MARIDVCLLAMPPHGGRLCRRALGHEGSHASKLDMCRLPVLETVDTADDITEYGTHCRRTYAHEGTCNVRPW